MYVNTSHSHTHSTLDIRSATELISGMVLLRNPKDALFTDRLKSRTGMHAFGITASSGTE